MVNTEVIAITTRYRRSSLRRRATLGAVLAALVGVIALDLLLGPSRLLPGDIWRGLLAGPNGSDHMLATILWQLRMPQTAMGVVVGACLGVAGLQMQTILANPLASPFTLGFSAAAGFGAALAIVYGSRVAGSTLLLVPLSAFIATLAATLMVYFVAILCGASAEIMVLAGIATLFLFQSLQSLLQYSASPEVLQQIVFWMFGSLLKASWASVGVSTAILVACAPLIARNAWHFTTLRLGDANARSLGLGVEALRRRTFLIVALLTAAAVSFVGTIGFVGLIAPHAARSLGGEDHRYSLPISAAMGSLTIVGASAIGKLIAPMSAIPVGIITATAGVPILFAIIFKRRRNRRSP